MKTNQPFFSVVIPCLNEEKYLPKLLDDLSEQTYRNFEVIVVDGKSVDKTMTRAKNYSSKLPSLVILTSSKRNVSIQRNMGGKRARGKWVVFMDADDGLPRNFLEGIKYRLSDESLDCFTCWATPENDSVAEKTIIQMVNLIMEVKRVGAIGSMIGVRKVLFDSSEGFNPKTGFGEDGDFVRSLIYSGKKYKVFRDPRYSLSLRRVRKDGLIISAGKYAKLFLKKVTNNNIDQKTEYPMGGDYFKDAQESAKFFTGIELKVREALKRPKIFSRLKSLLELEED